MIDSTDSKRAATPVLKAQAMSAKLVNIDLPPLPSFEDLAGPLDSIADLPDESDDRT